VRDAKRSWAGGETRADSPDGPKARDQNKATARVLTVLSAFASDAEAYGVTELSQRLGMTKNMVHRALTTLIDQGYLVRDEAGTRYELGYRVVELQNPHVPEPDLRTLCATAIRDFHRVTGETVSVCVRRGDTIVFVDGFETREPSVWRLEIGDLRPLSHPNSSARVILASLPDDEIADYLRRSAAARPAAGSGGDAFWADIAEIRERGYAINRRSAPPHMVAVAFPIRDPDGRAQGAISVGGPVERFERRLIEVLPKLQSISDELNSRTRLYPSSSILVIGA
jgi:DNA-binding IclR family transcriptional regulator